MNNKKQLKSHNEDSRNATTNAEGSQDSFSIFGGDEDYLAPVAAPKKFKSYASGTSIASSWSSIKDKVSSLAGVSTMNRSKEPSSIKADDYLGTSRRDLEGNRLLELLKESEFYKTLPEKNKKEINREQERKRGKIHALDVLTIKKNGEPNEIDPDAEELHTDRKQREKEEDEHRLAYLWKKRHWLTNWTLLSLFHIVVLLNLIFCMTETYRITIEHSKFDRHLLDDEFNCLEVILSGDSFNHFFAITHALTCVAVLFTESLESAKLCWGMICAQVLHLMADTFQFLYNIRFPTEDKTNENFESIFTFFAYSLFMIFSAAVILQRYYDMTNILQKRTQRYFSSFHSGRPLNEHIIFKNESNFMQKKYTLRQAQQLLIYGIVQKVQHYKTRGLIVDKKELQIDVKAAIAALTDLKKYIGPNVLAELKKRNLLRLKEIQNGLSVDLEVGKISRPSFSANSTDHVKKDEEAKELDGHDSQV